MRISEAERVFVSRIGVASPRELALALHRFDGWLEIACKPVANEEMVENENRLRGLLWNVAELRRCVANDPSDAEAEEAIVAAKRALLLWWNITSEPGDVVSRAHLAQDVAWLRAGRSSPREWKLEVAQ